MNVPQIALFSYGGVANLGDDLIATVLLNHLAGDITLFCPGRDFANQEIPQWLAENNTSVQLIDEVDSVQLRKFDVVVIGGGSLLIDYDRSFGTVVYWLTVVKKAIQAGCRVVFAFIGVGNIKHAISTLLIQIIELVDVIVVRDEPSRQRLKELGVHRRICVAADPVFLVSLTTPAARRHDNGPLRIGVNLRSYVDLYSGSQSEHFDFVSNFLAALVAIHSEQELEVTLIPFRTHDDNDLQTLYSLAEQLKQRGVPSCCINSVPDSIESIRSVFGRLDLFVGMRLHSIICALVAGIPSSGIVYAPKNESLLKLAGIPQFIIRRNMNTADVTQILRKLMHRRVTADPFRVSEIRRKCETGFEEINQFSRHAARTNNQNRSHFRKRFRLHIIWMQYRLALLVRRLQRQRKIRLVANLFGLLPAYGD
ncbi:MAG: polysaccharide pyruvyl transferase family protein [Fuerstiella sp.]|nr:polysaccharide pyruvyl transferase family protein [Fuerstiella sp.]